MPSSILVASPVRSSFVGSDSPRWSRKTGDRFIPARNAVDSEVSHHVLCSSDDAPSHKILAFKSKAPVPEAHNNHLRVLYSQNETSAPKKAVRQIPSAPEKVLDAPELPDDYYLNVLDWSVDNMLAVALGDLVCHCSRIFYDITFRFTC